jgi:ribonuclease Z
VRDSDYCTIAAPHFTIEGRSRAGHETWFRIRELGIALDIGRCPDVIVGLANVFVSHAHLDHAVGIPFYAGQRKLHRMDGGRVFVPAEAAEDFRELMAIHERLEGTPYNIEIAGIAADEVVRISRGLEVRAHAATHRVPARAYEVIEVRHHLRAEYSGLDSAELARLRRDGVEVAEEYRRPLLFYTGDTDRGMLETNAALFRAEVLMIECSFIEDEHLDRAAAYRHIHFDDLAEFAETFENELIVLTHFSRRYGRREIREGIRRRCPAVLRDRIRLALPEEWQKL